MYRLAIRNILFFIAPVVIGILCTSIAPKYFGGLRTLSLVQLFIIEAGISFIPVIALYPKASLVQAVVLAAIYFITMFLICFTSWGFNNIFFPINNAFAIKDGEFQINVISFIASNLFSFIALILNFKLVYDEELTKEVQLKGLKDKKTPIFKAPIFGKPLLNRPRFESTVKTKSSSTTKEQKAKKISLEESFEENLGKPFEFEPEIEISSEDLPEESKGKLFYKEEEENKPFSSEFFEEETEVKESPVKLKPKPLQVSTPQPGDIKADLAIIFEQYSSLNAIKKLTGSKTTKSYTKEKEEKKKRKPYRVEKETPSMSVHIEQEGQEIHEATFRQISPAETITEIKEELKKELQEKLEEKARLEREKAESTIKQTTETKEEIIQSIKNLTEELKQELQEKIQERVNQESQRIEETIQKTTDTKEEIIESIKSIKEELKKELLEELPVFEKEEKEEIEQPPEEEPTQEELKSLEDTLINLNKEEDVTGSLFVDMRGKVLQEKWVKEEISHKEVDSTIPELFNLLNKETGKTNQGSLSNLLLESDSGTIVLSHIKNKVLTIVTHGTGENYSGQILRKLSELEEEE